MAALAALGGVEHDEQVVGIGVDLGHLVALQAVPDGEWMEAEHLRQCLGGLLIAFGDIDPHEPILTLEQHLKLLDGTAFNALVGDQPDVHPAHPFPRPCVQPHDPPTRPQTERSRRADPGRFTMSGANEELMAMFGTSWRVGRIARIEVRVDLLGGDRPAHHLQHVPAGRDLYPELSGAGAVWIGVLATVLFFGSVLVHELAHALVAQARGSGPGHHPVPVRRRDTGQGGVPRGRATSS